MDNWKKAYRIDNDQAKLRGERGRKYRVIRRSKLREGDRVLIRNLTERGGPSKLRAHWEEAVHVIIKCRGEDSPVYEVKQEQGNGLTRVLHRILLLPCNDLPIGKHVPFQSKRSKTHRKISEDYNFSSQEEASGSLNSDDETAIITRPSTTKISPEHDHPPEPENNNDLIPHKDMEDAVISRDDPENTEQEQLTGDPNTVNIDLQTTSDNVANQDFSEPSMLTEPEEEQSDNRPRSIRREPDRLHYPMPGVPVYCQNVVHHRGNQCFISKYESTCINLH